MEDESFSYDLAGALEDEDDGEREVDFFELIITLRPVRGPVDAFIVVLKTQHDRVCDDDYHDERVEPLPLGEPDHSLTDLERRIENVQTAGVAAD